MSGRLDTFFEFLRRGLIEPLGRLGALLVTALRSLCAGLWRFRWRVLTIAVFGLIAYGLCNGSVSVSSVSAGSWAIDVLSPGLDNPEEGYVDYAGYAPGTRRLLIAREVKDHGRFRRSFEELRLDDLALVRQASSTELLRDFGRWQDVAWRRDTLALH